MAEPLIETRGLTKVFKLAKGKALKAVCDVDITLHPGETLAIVGESGCGKSTLARLLLKLETPTEGCICVEGQDISRLGGAAEKAWRRDLQMVFQDPYSSLNPRMTASQAIREPLDNFRDGTAATRNERVRELLHRVGLNDMHGRSYPHELSGGQRQRLCIARALALRPRIIVADEPVSALDVSVQAQVLNLLMDLQRDLGISIVFVSHDLSVVRQISHRVAVMYLGRIVERGTADAVFNAPSHPYTQALLASVPIEHPRERRIRTLLAGEIASPLDPPSGCAFRVRCSRAEPRCATETPTLRPDQAGGAVACHLVTP